MDDERFRLNKSNIIMILITIGSLAILGVSVLFLTNSYSKPIKELPDLSTTEGRTSTKYARETTTETTTTTTTTTKAPANSPYYSYNMQEMISEDLVTKPNLTKEEKETLLKQCFDFFSHFYDFTDTSVFKTDIVVNNVKAGETDVIEKNGHKYAEIYNGLSIRDNYLAPIMKNSLLGTKYNETPIFVENNGKLYRLEPTTLKGKPIFTSLKTSKFEVNKCAGEAQYYFSNYKEEGLSSPAYKVLNIELEFIEKRWRLKNFKFPIYD